MILEVIARARRRLLCNAMAAEGARAVCVALGLLVLLLLLGTDILGWQFLLFGPAATLLAGTYLTWRRLPDSRAAAQILDRRLGLLDAISTALFFWPAHPPRQFDEGMRDAQRDYTLRIAAGIDVRQALPLELPRAAYAGVALALLAGGLFGLRYGVQGRLDLRPPAAPAVVHLIEGMKSQLAALEKMIKQLDQNRPRDEKGKGKEQTKLAEKNDSDPNPNSGSPTETSNGEDQLAKKQDSTMASDEPGNQQERSGKDQAANAQNAPQQGNNNGQNGQPGQQDQRAASSDSSASDSNSDSSLLNKARDTMANLLSAVKPQPGGRGGSQSQMDVDRNARQQNGKSNGKAGADERKQDASASPSQGDPQGSESQAQQGAGSQSAGRPQGADSDKQPGMGAGRDEGDKQIKLAEQLAAMGKISMILGKRSQDVTGASSIEVVSGEQELRTRYETRKVKHNEVRAKAEQDQVPVELQEYVSRYFQEVRGTAPAGRSTRPGASTGSASRSSDASVVQKQK